ncbi:amidohydrolase family protein [Kytococcus sp. Marseille-QA3725]
MTLDLVDHHCHGVVTVSPDRAGLEDLLTESDAPAPPGTSFFDTQLGFAVRRECAPVLDLPPFAAPEEYVARRGGLGPQEVNRRLLRAARIGNYIIETGHRSDDILSPAQMGKLAGAGFAEVTRLEVLAEQVAGRAGAEDYPAAFRSALDRALRTSVGVKTIAAYRAGLDLDPERPDEAEVVRAVQEWTADGNRGLRLEDPVVIRFGLWEAIDRGVPIQVHVGYGDPDVDLHRCNPLLMTELLRRSRGSGALWTLLHCYPYHREAGYLAHVFEHVYCDVGLAVNFTGAQSAQVIAESLELTPFHKALFSSDAFGAAELYHLGALLFRRGLAAALQSWGERAGWPVDEQLRVARMIGSENARRVYELDRVATITRVGEA